MSSLTFFEVINHPETNGFDNLMIAIEGNLPRYTRVLKGVLAALETADLVSIQNDEGVEVKENSAPINQFG